MIKYILFASFCAVFVAQAYDNGYQPGDNWMLEESFLENNEGGGRFRQGDPKAIFNADDEIWFYLQAAPGDEPASAEPLPFCGHSPIGPGWSADHGDPPDQEPPRIGGYPYIVRGSGSAEKSIYVHPGQSNDLIVAWQAPVGGNFKAEAMFERGGDTGDGQKISWTADSKILAEATVPAQEGATELAAKNVKLAKGDRLYFRLNNNGSANDDGGVIYVQVTYEGP